MTRQELITRLHMLADERDIEVAHIRADEALLNFIDDSEVADAYDALTRWYA